MRICCLVIFGGGSVASSGALLSVTKKKRKRKNYRNRNWDNETRQRLNVNGIKFKTQSIAFKRKWLIHLKQANSLPWIDMRLNTQLKIYIYQPVCWRSTCGSIFLFSVVSEPATGTGQKVTRSHTDTQRRRRLQTTSTTNCQSAPNCPHSVDSARPRDSDTLTASISSSAKRQNTRTARLPFYGFQNKSTGTHLMQISTNTKYTS